MSITLTSQSYDQWLRAATQLLRDANITSARLDAELLLAHTVRKSRTYIHAHGDTLLDARQRDIADARLQLRLDRTPIAYIIGHKEFYRRSFKVTPATLIPRPESEDIITLLHDTVLLHQRDGVKHLVDVGTGTGCLGITAKLEFPLLDVAVIDNSRHALTVAAFNSKKLSADVALYQSDLLTGYVQPVDIIIANLPYVDTQWERSPETDHEPSGALFADNEGLDLIYTLIEQAASVLSTNGYMLLESDLRQQQAIIAFAHKHSFEHITTRGLITCFRQRDSTA